MEAITKKIYYLNEGMPISGEPIKIGTKRFPNPPIKAGITHKKNHDKSMRSYKYIIKLIISVKDLITRMT